MDAPIRKKVADLATAVKENRVGSKADMYTIQKFNDTAVTTAKCRYPMKLDLEGMKKLEELHRKYCH